MLGEAEQEVAPTPQNLVGTTLSPTRIQLMWDAVPSATKYIIMRGPAPGTEVSYTSYPAITTYVNGHISPGEQTCWQVKSVVGPESSLPSNEVCLTTPDAPGPPTDVTATAISSSRITVTWTAIPNAVRYTVYESLDAAGPYSAIGSPAGPTFTSANLSPGTTYFYRVSTVFQGGESAQSDPPASATTFAAGLEGYWKLDEDMGTVANDSSGNDRDGSLLGAAAFTSIAKAPLDNNPSAVNVPGGAGDAISVPHNSLFSFAGDFTLALWIHLPAAPAGTLRIAGKRVAGCGAATTWELAQDAANGLHFRGTTIASFGTTLPINTWSHIAVTRQAGTLHLYLDGVEVASAAHSSGGQVLQPMLFGNSGGCGGGASMNLDEIKVLSRALSASEVSDIGARPPAPTNLTGMAPSPTQIDLSWSATAGATKYTVYRGTTSGDEVFYTNIGAEDTLYSNGHIMPGETTSWQVSMTVNGIVSERSNEVVLTTPGAPPPPTNVAATAASSSRINLTWDAVPLASKYFVYQSDAGGPFAFKGTATSTSFSANGLTANTMYTYVVRTVANDGVTQSADSAPASATTLP